MSDPHDELYETKREACETGKYLGAADAISRARSSLSQLSGKYERDADPAKFHAVEECCGVLRKIAEMIEYDRERTKLGGNH
jgi:hypothetical protein